MCFTVSSLHLFPPVQPSHTTYSVLHGATQSRDIFILQTLEPCLRQDKCHLQWHPLSTCRTHIVALSRILWPSILMRNCNHGNTILWCCHQTMGDWSDVFKLFWRPHLPLYFSTCVSECKTQPQGQNLCKDCTSQRQTGRSMPDQSKPSTFFFLHV